MNNFNIFIQQRMKELSLDIPAVIKLLGINNYSKGYHSVHGWMWLNNFPGNLQIKPLADVLQVDEKVILDKIDEVNLINETEKTYLHLQYCETERKKFTPFISVKVMEAWYDHHFPVLFKEYREETKLYLPENVLSSNYNNLIKLLSDKIREYVLNYENLDEKLPEMYFEAFLAYKEQEMNIMMDINCNLIKSAPQDEMIHLNKNDSGVMALFVPGSFNDKFEFYRKSNGKKIH